MYLHIDGWTKVHARWCRCVLNPKATPRNLRLDHSLRRLIGATNFHVINIKKQTENANANHTWKIAGWSESSLLDYTLIVTQVLQFGHVMRKTVLPYADNKGADQPAHPRSLISAFVVRCLESIIQNSKTLASLWSWAGWFECYLVANSEDRFSHVEAQLIDCVCNWKICPRPVRCDSEYLSSSIQSISYQ